MSTEFPTLEELHNDTQSLRAADDGDGAAHGGPMDYRGGEPEDAGCCRSCGTPVEQEATRPSEVQRVFGDRHGRVPAGPCCSDVQTFAKSIQGVSKTSERARRLSPIEAYEREVTE